MGIGGVEYHGHTWEWGARKAKEMLFTGRAMTAKEAEQIGMVTRVVPLDELRSRDARARRRDREAPSVRAAPGEARREPDARRAGLLRRDPVGLRGPPERPRPRAQRIRPADPDAARRHEGRDPQAVASPTQARDGRNPRCRSRSIPTT